MVSSFERERTAQLILRQLQTAPMPLSLQELATQLDTEAAISQGLVTEVAWKLVEAGEAQFTSSWDLAVAK
ncbi:MAG: hypothetical protein AAGG02_00555 [Cyanobacteria bacterium P01_H01_bin.15]